MGWQRGPPAGISVFRLFLFGFSKAFWHLESPSTLGSCQGLLSSSLNSLRVLGRQCLRRREGRGVVPFHGGQHPKAGSNAYTLIETYIYNMICKDI